MNMSESHRCGELGENLARSFLEACGHRHLASRFRIPGGEIDLIMRRGDTVVFVEVKTRQGSWCDAGEAFPPGQLARMRKAARSWLHSHPGEGTWVTFDAVAVQLRPDLGEARIQHFMGVG
jgi:putative endonuclease